LCSKHQTPHVFDDTILSLSLNPSLTQLYLSNSVITVLNMHSSRSCFDLAPPSHPYVSFPSFSRIRIPRSIRDYLHRIHTYSHFSLFNLFLFQFCKIKTPHSPILSQLFHTLKLDSSIIIYTFHTSMNFSTYKSMSMKSTPYILKLML
jgi:hypothetical protein